MQINYRNSRKPHPRLLTTFPSCLSLFSPPSVFFPSLYQIFFFFFFVRKSKEQIKERSPFPAGREKRRHIQKTTTPPLQFPGLLPPLLSYELSLNYAIGTRQLVPFTNLIVITTLATPPSLPSFPSPMRKLLSAIHSYGRESNNIAAAAAYMYNTTSSSSSSSSPAPSPSYLDLLAGRNPSLYFLPPIPPVVDSAFDFITLAIITALLLLCLLSLFFIFHLRLKSRLYTHLRDFNSLWTVRILLVLFVSGWAFNEITQLPFFYRHNLLPFPTSLNLETQIILCKLHVVLSLGFFEPGFLVTLLFLINISVKQRNPGEVWSVSSVFLMILPAFFLQTIFVFFTPLQSQLPLVMIRNYVLSIDALGNQCITCTCPLLSSIIFGAFAVMYSVGLLLSCWRVISLVINKNIRVRINMLGLTVMISLLTQTLLLGAESLWTPEDMAFGGMMLGVFMSVAVSAAVGEVVLVIKPIVEALAAGNDCCQWSPGIRLRPVPESDGN